MRIQGVKNRSVRKTNLPKVYMEKLDFVITCSDFWNIILKKHFLNLIWRARSNIKRFFFIIKQGVCFLQKSQHYFVLKEQYHNSGYITSVKGTVSQ